MDQLFFAKSLAHPVRVPADVKPWLGDPELHWKPHGSAWKLAHRWVEANGLPDKVRAVLSTVPNLGEARLVDGIFEYDVHLRTRGRHSQTDLMARLHTVSGPVTMAVEGKVLESFGPVVETWITGEPPGRVARLAGLCVTLGLEPQAVRRLRYQIFHRTASAIYEAQARQTESAIMLVHSFDPGLSSFDDYERFARALGAPVTKPDTLSSPVEKQGVKLRLGWCADAP